MTQPVRVVLIGCGGIGTWLGAGLSKALQFQAPGSIMIVIDGDTFEPRNAERQAFSALGNKAHVMRDDIQRDNPNTIIIAMAAWIVDEETAAKQIQEDEGGGIIVQKISARSVLEDEDIIYVCVDNFAARKLILDAAKQLRNVDLFIGGNDDRLYGTVYHYRRRDGQDVILPPDYFHPELENPPDRNPGEMSCQERAELEGGTQLLAINMAVASTMLAKTAHVIFGTDDELSAALEHGEIYMDLEQGRALPSDRRPTEEVKEVEAVPVKKKRKTTTR